MTDSVRRRPVRYASRWTVHIDQRDEDGFHGTEEWIDGPDLYVALDAAIAAAKTSSYTDSPGGNSRKFVITVEREKR